MLNGMHNKGLYLFAPFVALAAVACGPRNISSPGMIGLDVRVTGGATVNQEIDFTNATLLTLNIQPQNSSTSASASEGYIIVNGKKVVGKILSIDSNTGRAGDLSSTITWCQDIKSGKNIDIPYAFTNNKNSVIESGKITLSSAIGKC